MKRSWPPVAPTDVSTCGTSGKAAIFGHMKVERDAKVFICEKNTGT